jgi:hypothetical protein
MNFVFNLVIFLRAHPTLSLLLAVLAGAVDLYFKF